MIGIIPGAGGTQRLPRLVGAAKGAELCLTGRVIQAEEAERIGLLNAVLPTEGFRGHAVAWCEEIAKHPAAAVFAAKQAVVDGFSKPLLEGLQLESSLFIGLNSSDEAKARNDAVRSGQGDISQQGDQ